MSESSENSSSDIDEDMPPLEEVEEEYLDISYQNIQDKVCCCVNLDNVNKANNWLDTEVYHNVNSSNINCILDNFIRARNVHLQENLGLKSHERLAFCDIFYKARHELLYKLTMLSLNQPQDKSDVPFSICGIDSNRTPDFIHIDGNDIHILEITASSNYENAARLKGLEEAGFESKYQKEIEQLLNKGFRTFYYPFIFDMSNVNNNEYNEQFLKLKDIFKINNLYKPLLHYVKDFFCNLTNSLRIYLLPMASMLFIKIEKTVKRHSDFDFLYTSDEPLLKRCKYLELTISSTVYSKFVNMWARLLTMLENYDRYDKIAIVLDTSSHKIKVEEYQQGFTYQQYYDVISNNNKMEFFKMIWLKIGSVYKKATDSDTGMSYYDQCEEVEKSDVESFSLISNHLCSNYNHEYNDYNKYKEKINYYFKYKYNSIHYDSNYEEKLMNYIKGYDLTCNNLDETNNYVPPIDLNFLGDKSLNNVDIDNFMLEMKLLQLEKNQELSIPLKIKKAKNPFILPIANINSSNYCNLNFKNENFLYTLKMNIETLNPYTTMIIENVLKDSFDFMGDHKQPSNYLNEMQKELRIESIKMSELSNNYLRYAKTNNLNSLKISSATDKFYKEGYTDIKSKISKLNKEINSRKKIEKLGNFTNLIRLPTRGKKTQMANSYQVEMAHYKSKKIQSTYEGVGVRTTLEKDFNYDETVFQNIISDLTISNGDNPDLFYKNIITDDVSLLTELKTMAYENYKDLINKSINSKLGHACAFISRIAHTLMYLSQLPFSSDYIRVDNLGYKNCLIIVKGGKKIFKSKSSKLFRLIYPVLETTLPWIFPHNIQNSSSTLFYYEQKPYILSPWIQWHESILTDSISFYPRVMSFVVLNSNPLKSFESQFNNIAFNVILAFHNRRNTEALLANLRYILLATLGDYTGILDIFKEFFDFNYDCFQSYIRNCILFNYVNYFKDFLKIKLNEKTINFKDIIQGGLKNIFTGSDIISEDQLALMIYSTFLMTKAPYQRPIERANNLKNIIKIHEDYDNKIGLNLTPLESFNKTTVVMDEFDDYTNYITKLFDNDFNFDPKYIALLSNFADSFYRNKNLEEEMHIKWVNILNNSWDELSTSTGLRGKITDIYNFWGQKGYFIVYKELINDSDYLNSIQELLFNEKSEDENRKQLRKLNYTYNEKIDVEQEFLIFHTVDKTQWRGSREIYVMDIETKTLQQPIEKYMAFLCKHVDNELISISSDRRAQTIHHAIFEKDLPLKDALTWYLTLDCTKWAPKSNIYKNLVFIIGMNTIPSIFKTHFLNYHQKLYKKRMYYNEAEVKVLLNNPNYTQIINKYLIWDDSVKGYYMLMPYSWVMGIFNYTSSLLHAFNQKYAAYIIFKSSILNYQIETTLVMFAHSDDSGGRITSINKNLITRGLILYEIELKKCNHLISKKKSVVSRLYFEILSVIYLFNKLLALLPKFLGGIRFTPTDKGPAQDMLQSYSKCIEVMIAGADFSTAYLVMKFYSFLIYRFYYHGTTPCKNDFTKPVQYLGLPDAHPLMVLLCGSDSDIVRIMHCYGCEDLINLLAFTNNYLSTIDNEGPIKPIKFDIKVKGLKKGFEMAIEKFKPFYDNNWPVGNVNFKNTVFNLLTFLKKLDDPGFVGSLVNESLTRRLSRSFYMRKGDCVRTYRGFTNLEEVKDALNTFQKFSNDSESTVKYIYRKYLNENQQKEIVNFIEANKLTAKTNIETLKLLLQSPLNICQYMDVLTLKNKNIVKAIRTLKPTHLELKKSITMFSNDIDPMQLVSYMKYPKFNWALPNLKGLFQAELEAKKLLNNFNLNVEKMMPETLLKLFMDYSKKSTKEIYLYSNVPSDLRNIKTYSSFLTFLACNSLKDKEIEGMVLKVDNEVDPGYLPLIFDYEIYIINNLINLLINLFNVMDIENFSKIMMNRFDDIDYKGGDIINFLNFVEHKQFKDDSYKFLLIQVNYIKNIINIKNSNTEALINAEFVNKGAYYTFLKSQKSKTGWYGKGELGIYIAGKAFIFEVFNNSVINVKTNYIGKLLENDNYYIREVLEKNNLYLKKVDMKIAKSYKSDYFFGLDQQGTMSVIIKKEATVGYPAEISSHSKLPNTMFYHIKYISSNSFFLESIDKQAMSFKIYTLNLIKGDLYSTLMKCFNHDSFRDLCLTKGLNDYEDFILTELLTNYGGQTTIGFQDFIDNYPASKLYEIFKTVKDNSFSKIPNVPITAFLPASEGSLLRVIIDYSLNTNDNIIKPLTNLNQQIMQLRSEYPENTSIILSESLVKMHDKIYEFSESMEIQQEYYNLLSADTTMSQKRSGYINLLKHWGYGALVNLIETYSFGQEKLNYEYFNITCMTHVKTNIFVQVFVNMYNIIEKNMLNYSHNYYQLDFATNKLINTQGMVEMLEGMRNYLCLTHHNYDIFLCYQDYNSLCFLNCFNSLLKDDSFINSLNYDFKNDNILCTIPITYSKRTEFIACFNSLKCGFIRSRKDNYSLDYIKKLHRLPVNVKGLNEIYNSTFNLETIKLTPKATYYNNFLNDYIADFLKKPVRIEVDNVRYNIIQNIKKPSEVSVPMNQIILFKRPINEEVMELEDWDELLSELEMTDLDEDTIKDLCDSLKEQNLYKNKETFKKGNVVNTTVNWIVQPYCEGVIGIFNKLRQIGENIVFLTTVYNSNFINLYPNSRVKLINMSGMLNYKCPDMVAYISSNKILNVNFWDNFLPGKDLNINESDVNVIEAMAVRDSRGQIIRTNRVGITFNRESLEKERDTGDVSIPDKMHTENELELMKLKIKECHSEGLISKKRKDYLIEKYVQTAPVNLTFNELFKNMMTEVDLEGIHNNVKGGLKELTTIERTKIFQSPESFKLAYKTNVKNKSIIKDKKVEAELNSIDSELARLVSTDNCTISSDLKKVLLNNFKMWKITVRGSRHKIDNKKFLLTIFSTLLSGGREIDESENDFIWQRIANKITNYIADDPDTDDEDELEFDTSFLPSARLKYRPAGM